MNIFCQLIEVDYGLLKAIKELFSLLREKSKREVLICCPGHWGEIINSGI